LDLVAELHEGDVVAVWDQTDFLEAWKILMK
jgi:hypothetical protein